MSGTVVTAVPPPGKNFKPRKPEIPSFWLDALRDPLANAQVYSQCIAMGDLFGDADYKLIIATPDKKMRVWKGIQVISELTLVDVPVAIECFYIDANVPSLPCKCVNPEMTTQAIGVALRPFCKLTLPPLDVNSGEQQVWDDLREKRAAVDVAIQRLVELRDRGVALTQRSIDLILMEEPERDSFVASMASLPLAARPMITCAATLKRGIDVDTEPSYLLVGTESGFLFTLDAATSKIVAKVKLDSVPLAIAVEGVFQAEYRVAVACRNGRIYLIRVSGAYMSLHSLLDPKDGRLLSASIDPETPVAHVLLSNKQVLVASAEGTIHCYSFKARRLFMLLLQQPVRALEAMVLSKIRMFKVSARGRDEGFLVALPNEVRVYSESTMVVCTPSEDTIGMCFGTLGREEGALVTTHRGGALRVRLLARQAALDAAGVKPGPPPEQDVPLSIPRKSQLYIEQSQREIETCLDMHRIFQRDLCKLHLETSRAFVRLLQDGQGPLAGVLSATLQLTAQVQGLGPNFLARLSVENMSKAPVYHVPVLLQYRPEIYEVETPITEIPLLLPGLVHTLDIPVRCVDPAGGADVLSIHLCAPRSAIPVLSAIINMPPCELLDPGMSAAAAGGPASDATAPAGTGGSTGPVAAATASPDGGSGAVQSSTSVVTVYRRADDVGQGGKGSGMEV